MSGYVFLKRKKSDIFIAFLFILLFVLELIKNDV